jgi:hypothetical protein
MTSRNACCGSQVTNSDGDWATRSNERIASSESKRWALQTERPLFDFDPTTAVAIERYLTDWLDRLQRDAQE